MKNLITLFGLFTCTLSQTVGQGEMATAGGHLDLSTYDFDIPRTNLKKNTGKNDHREPGIAHEGDHQNVVLVVEPDFTENLNFSLQLNDTEVVEIRLFDTEGRQIRNLQTATKMTPGIESYSSNVERLKVGQYLLVVYTSERTIARSLTKV